MWRQQLKTGEPADVAALFGCSVGSLPGNVCLIGCTSAVGCFVPVANDFSDLGTRLEWCRTNDAACREIAERARRRAVVVYAPETVARIVAETWPTDG